MMKIVKIIPDAVDGPLGRVIVNVIFESDIEFSMVIHGLPDGDGMISDELRRRAKQHVIPFHQFKAAADIQIAIGDEE